MFTDKNIWAKQSSKRLDNNLTLSEVCGALEMLKTMTFEKVYLCSFVYNIEIPVSLHVHKSKGFMKGILPGRTINKTTAETT